MPVWAVWMADALWFSCSNDSRKTRNLRADGRCSLATDDPTAPVVAQGVAEVVADAGDLRKLLDAENAKYGTDYGIEMLDPTLNTCFKVRPRKVIGLEVADFTGSPTRWIPA
jgi:general stress protein 26